MMNFWSKKYVETMIHRTFGTENGMKLGKPIPKEKQTAPNARVRK